MNSTMNISVFIVSILAMTMLGCASSLHLSGHTEYANNSLAAPEPEAVIFDASASGRDEINVRTLKIVGQWSQSLTGSQDAMTVTGWQKS